MVADQDGIAVIRYIVPPPTTSRARPPHRGRVQFQLTPDGLTPTFSSARQSTKPEPVAAGGITARGIVSTPSSIVNDADSRPGTVLPVASLGSNLDSPGVVGSSDGLGAFAEQMQVPVLRLQPADLTPAGNALEPNLLQQTKQPKQQLQNLQRRQRPAAHRPPSPFMAQLDVYYKRLAAKSAREARSVPSGVWTELALRNTAMHDWPNNLSQRWRKRIHLRLKSVHVGNRTWSHLGKSMLSGLNVWHGWTQEATMARTWIECKQALVYLR
jgi:hypothetical protein